MYLVVLFYEGIPQVWIARCVKFNDSKAVKNGSIKTIEVYFVLPYSS